MSGTVASTHRTRKHTDPSDEINGARHNSLSLPETSLEIVNPLGRQVTLLSAVMLNIGQMTGSGIYSVPGVILSSVGSIGMLLLYWCLAPMFAFAGLTLYSELASMNPTRSGAEVVYLEQAYPKPRYLVSTIYAVAAIVLFFSPANAVVFAQYFLIAFELPITAYGQTTVALGVIIVSAAIVAASTKWSLRVVNFLTTLKLLFLLLMAAVGIAVLTGITQVENPYRNFHNIFQGSTFNLNGLATAFVKVNHAFIGWHNSFNVLGEIKSSNPVKIARKASIIALSLVSVIFLLVNVAYVAAVPREDIRNSGQLVAALFFHRVFGPVVGNKVLPLMVALSCFGNLVAVIAGQARILREIARQGLLPQASFLSSTKPLGTPLGPITLKASLMLFGIMILPAKDAFNFVLDLASYPSLFGQCAMVVGVWIIRKRRLLANNPPSTLQARNSTVIVYLLFTVLLLVLPWVPPAPAHADVSFWYATYCVTGLGILLASGIYYWLWIIALPKWGGYDIVEDIQDLPDGTRMVRLTRRYTRQMGETEALITS